MKDGTSQEFVSRSCFYIFGVTSWGHTASESETGERRRPEAEFCKQTKQNQRRKRTSTQPKCAASLAATRARRAAGRSKGRTPGRRRLLPEQGASGAEAAAAEGRQHAPCSPASARRLISLALTRARRAVSLSAAEGRCCADDSGSSSHSESSSFFSGRFQQWRGSRPGTPAAGSAAASS